MFYNDLKKIECDNIFINNSGIKEKGDKTKIYKNEIFKPTLIGSKY